MLDYSISPNNELVDLVDSETGEIVQTIEKSVFVSDYRICEDCGYVFHKNNMTYCDSDGAYYCEVCRDECLTQCADCGGWYLNDEVREISVGWRRTKWVCESCAEEYGTSCAYCGEWRQYEDLTHCVDSDNYYCRDNYRCNDNIYWCEDCGDAFEYDDSVYWNDDDEAYYCENCYSRHESYVGSYHSHYYDEFRCNPGENRSLVPFIGFELETYADDRCAEHDIAEYTNDEFDSYFAMERDCSIGDGIEFISQPCSISYHLGLMPEIAAWSRYLVNHGYNSHNSARCGFHIHLDKKYFGSKLDCATAKLLYLFERHWDNMLRFSRRNSEQVRSWCGRYEKHDEEDCGQRVVPGKKFASIIKKSYKERYRAINLCPHKTIEIRMWRGSLNPETIEATLKFTARLMELCKKVSAVELSKMSFEDLLGDDPVVRSYWDRVKDRRI